MKKDYIESYSLRNDGSIEIGFTDLKSKHDYDTTKLVINTDSFDVDGHTLYNCLISWYDSKSTNKSSFYNIIVEFNKDLLLGDSDYLCYFMRNLLNKKRVVGYLKRGLTTNPDFECGFYVGGVFYNDSGKLEKLFFNDIGRKFHNEDYIVELRREFKKR